MTRRRRRLVRVDVLMCALGARQSWVVPRGADKPKKAGKGKGKGKSKKDDDEDDDDEDDDAVDPEVAKNLTAAFGQAPAGTGGAPAAGDKPADCKTQ